MKIRLAINSDFVSRKVRGAAYGILLLLTFLAPQFAKTQDQLNSAKAVRAIEPPGIALEQKQSGTSLSVSDDSRAIKANLAVAQETPAYIDDVEIAALTIPAVHSIAVVPTPETVGVSESSDTLPAREEIAALTTPAIPLVTTEMVPEAGRVYELPAVEPVKRISEPVVVQPVLTASLSPAILPTAQSSAPASARITGNTSDKIERLDVVDMPLVDFFRTMSELGGVNIMLDPAVTGNVTLMVTDVAWDQLFNAVLINYGLDKKIDGSLFRVALKKTLQDEARQEEELKKAQLMAGELETRVRRLNYAKSAELKSIITDQKSERGIVVVDDRTNSFVLTDLPDYIDKLVKLIELLDIPQHQVEIETRIVSATRNFARDIGIQFGFLHGNSQRVSVGGSNANYLANGSRPMGDTGTSNNSPGVSVGSGDAGGNLNVNLPSRTPFGGIGVAVGNVFDLFLLDAAITAGESKGSAKLISQPKVLVQNNSPAVINNGVRFPVQVISDNTVSIQFFDAALTLTVTPQITYEGNIMLDLSVTNNRADFSMQVNNVPTIRTSEATTRILVSDGGTTALGGIFVEDDSNSEDRVPGLGSLPILGHLFRRNAVNRDTQEVLFFVTPRILR